IGRGDYVFAEEAGNPLSQEWLHKRIWLPTLRVAGLRERGQYNIRDTFITLALSAGEDPGWVAAVCGTSEQMIFRHYRKWMPNTRRADGGAVARVFAHPVGHQMGTRKAIRARKLGSSGDNSWRRGELNPRPRAVRLERLRSLVGDLISPRCRPPTGFAEASSSDFSSPSVRAPAGAYPDLRRLSRPYGLEPVRRRSP